MFNSLQPGFSTGNILSKSEIRKRLQLMGIDPNKKNSDKNKNAKLSLNEEYNLAIQNPENLEKIKKEIEEDKEINNIKLEEIKKDFSNRKILKTKKFLEDEETSEKIPLFSEKTSVENNISKNIFTKIPKRKELKVDNLYLNKKEQNINSTKHFLLGSLIGSFSTAALLLSKSKNSNYAINQLKKIDFEAIAIFFNNILHPIKNYFYIIKPKVAFNFNKIFSLVVPKLYQIFYELEKYDSFTLLEFFFIGYITLIIFKFFLRKIFKMIKAGNE
jgi:hypothetical protein